MDSVLYAFLWFPIGKDYPKGEWYELKPHLYGWEMDFKPGQKPLRAYYWHYGEHWAIDDDIFRRTYERCD